MSCFRPDGSAGGTGAFIGYSPYCVPRVVGGVKGVIVNEALRELEPMAWDFVMNFARDNDLVVVEHPDPTPPEPVRAPTRPRDAKKARDRGPFFVARGSAQAAVASAFTLAARRLLWRAALFLWKRPLSATESITGWAVLKSSAALALSPASTAFCTFLMTVRKLRAQRGVGGVELDVLAGALQPGGDADGLLLGFGGGGHACLR